MNPTNIDETKSKICVAPSLTLNEDGTITRCKLPVFGKSKHCEKHHPKAKELYLKYKNLTSKVYKLDIFKEIKYQRKKIEYLRKCHAVFLEAYNARVEHHNYAFSLECRDYGHDLQLKIIKEKIDKCGEELKKLTGNIPDLGINDDDVDNDETLDNEDGDKEDESETKSEERKNKSRKNKKKKQKEKEAERIIEKYSHKNSILLEEKKKNATLLVKLLHALSGTEDVHVNRGIVALIFELWSQDYFDEDYEPEVCDCDCGAYLSMIFHLCSDIQSYQSTIELIESNENWMLKLLYKKIITNLKKIKPITNDLLTLFKVYGKKTLTMNIEMTWSTEMNRLVIKHSPKKFAPENKPSRILAMQRMRDRTMMELKKIHDMGLCGRDDTDCDCSDCD